MIELQIEPCEPENAEAISNLLEELSALSVTLMDKYDDPILEPDIGTMPLWPQSLIHALFATYAEAALAKQVLSDAYPALTIQLQEVPAQDWERVCMDRFKATCFGNRLWVCPSWDALPSSDAKQLILDPGLAFGTGTHPTTSLCLRWLDETDVTNLRVVDYGCGSGILGLAALILGANHVHAVDIDEQALIATQNNANLNRINPAQITVGFPDELDKPVDLVMANILLFPLLRLQKRFRSLLHDNGVLLVSGLLVEQVDGLIEAYGADFQHRLLRTENEWALLAFVPKSINSF